MQIHIKSIALTAGLFFITSLAIAGNSGVIEKANKENVRREIIRSITCPDFVTENSDANDVKALVSVDDNGNVTLYEVNSANPQLKNYVANTLKEMKLKTSTPTEKFVLVVKFRVA